MPVSDSSQGSHSKQGVEPFLEKELDSNVFEISTQSFFSAFLPSPPSLSDENAAVVECLSALTRNPERAEHSTPTQDGIHNDKADIEALNIPFHDGTSFCSLEEARQESEIYPKLEALLNFINSFYRQTLGLDNDGVAEVDKAWPLAAQPWTDPTESPPPPSSPSLPDYLSRRFLDIHGRVPLCRHCRDENPKVSPDLALLLIGTSDGPEPPKRLTWKDIKIPIEVKMCADNSLAQIAQYARCVKLEQFDRKFVLTLTFTQHTCRVARWDPAVCYITEEIQLHQAKPLDFIKLIGRLVCTSPSALGYDERFSNAGRVLDVQADRKLKTPMRTTLTIIPSEIQEEFGNEPPQQVGLPQRYTYLLEDRMLCRVRDDLFQLAFGKGA